MKKIIAILGVVFLPFVAKAQDLGGKLLTDTGTKNAGYQDVGPEMIVGAVINTLLGVLGVIFLALTVYGGYIWMIARGDEAKVEKAKNTIINSVIGLVIVLAAYAITYFVFSYITKTSLRSP